MTKAELINKISLKTGVEKVTSLAVIEAFMNEVKDTIVDVNNIDVNNKSKKQI